MPKMPMSRGRLRLLSERRRQRLTKEQDRERQINQRAHEIRYGDGCDVEEAMHRATEEFEEWRQCLSSQVGA